MHLADLIEQLARPFAYDHATDGIEVHQTHISAVFLAGPYAYKIKKPVSLGFLDFSTLEKRKHFCEAEVRLNRRLAPDVYVGVIPVTGPTPRFGGTGSVIEWGVKMKRLTPQATLESWVKRDEATPDQLRAIAGRLVQFHREAERGPHVSSLGRFDVVAHHSRENFTQTATHVGVTVCPRVYERLRILTETQLEHQRDRIEARADRGVPCDTHGDLHLDHVYLFPEESPPNDLVIIDCIEFSERYRYADPVADMAFLAMDLAYHGRRDLASLFTTAYFDAAGDPEGRTLLRMYTAYRAVIRAKVEGMKLNKEEIERADRQAAEQRARAYWLLALGELEEADKRPALVLIAGLPGSGKSTLAQFAAERANFHVLRSDLVRKEIAAATTPAALNEGIYTKPWTERTYAELLKRTEYLFWQGERVIVDANFREQELREPFFEAAVKWGVPVYFIHCVAEPEVTRTRLQQRHGDASDADWGVYQQLAKSWQGVPIPWQRIVHIIETSGTLESSQGQLLDILHGAGLLDALSA